MSAIIQQLVMRRRAAFMQAAANSIRYEQLIASAKGKDGNAPAHEWDGAKLRFRNPDGTWGKWVNLRGKKGEKGSAGADGRTIISGGWAQFNPATLPLLPDAAQPGDDLIIERAGQMYRVPLSALQISPGASQSVTVDGEQVTVNGQIVTRTT